MKLCFCKPSFLIAILGLFSLSNAAWLASNNPALTAVSSRRSILSQAPVLHASSLSSSLNGDDSSFLPTVQRLSIHGVSVSPDGFWLILQNPQSQSDKVYLPVQVTDDYQDEFAATSAESLTLIQLLSGVDMAGAILPPDALARMVVHHCEEDEEEEEEEENESSGDSSGENEVEEYGLKEQIQKFVRVTLPSSEPSYSEAHPWYRSKVRLPTASLNELKMELTPSVTFSLECAVKDFGSISFVPSPFVLEEVCYRYSPTTSMAFISLALAMRYKAPIVMHHCSESLSDSQFVSLDELKERFPMFATADTLRQSSTRVHQNIERGFEVHKLSRALDIARQRGDQEAAKKIQAKLDEYDSLDELPTLPIQDSTDTDTLQ